MVHLEGVEQPEQDGGQDGDEQVGPRGWGLLDAAEKIADPVSLTMSTMTEQPQDQRPRIRLTTLSHGAG